MPSSNQKTVLLVLPSVQAGGTENYILRLLRHSGSQEFCWHIVSLDPVKGDLHDAMESTGASIHYQSIGYGNPLKLFQFYNLLRRTRVDTISTFTGNFGGLALTVAKWAGVKNRIGWYRATEPAYKPSLLKTGYDKLVNHLLWKNATLVLSNSHSALLRHQPPGKQTVPVKVIDNGVDARQFQTSHLSRDEAKQRLSIPTANFTVSHVGRVDPAKNHETIFKAMKEVMRQISNVQLLFCGKGTDSPGFLERMRRHGVDGIAMGLGLRQDLNVIYAASDLFYFPSVTEGQPNALIEALICEVPILASNIAAIQEVLPEEYQEWLIDPHDWKLAADKIVKAIRGEIRMPRLNRDYAVNRFDSNKAFNAFLSHL